METSNFKTFQWEELKGVSRQSWSNVAPAHTKSSSPFSLKNPLL